MRGYRRGVGLHGAGDLRGCSSRKPCWLETSSTAIRHEVWEQPVKVSCRLQEEEVLNPSCLAPPRCDGRFLSCRVWRFALIRSVGDDPAFDLDDLGFVCRLRGSTPRSPWRENQRLNSQL